VLLRCLHGQATVSTRLLDGRSIIRSLGAVRLRSALVQPRRPMRNGKQLLRLLRWADGGSCSLLRWDSIYLHPASPGSATVLRDVTEFLRQAPCLEVNLLESGDTLLIDNWRFLHGRSPAPQECRRRVVERVYLKEIR
jgi:hypothetical protein